MNASICKDVLFIMQFVSCIMQKWTHYKFLHHCISWLFIWKMKCNKVQWIFVLVCMHYASCINNHALWMNPFFKISISMVLQFFGFWKWHPIWSCCETFMHFDMYVCMHACMHTFAFHNSDVQLFYICINWLKDAYNTVIKDDLLTTMTIFGA